MDVWFKYEARFAQQNTATKLCVKRALDREQYGSNSSYMRADYPSKNATKALCSPVMNKDVMSKHLEQISRATPEAWFAVAVMDGSDWHTEVTFEDLKNLVMI